MPDYSEVAESADMTEKKNGVLTNTRTRAVCQGSVNLHHLPRSESRDRVHSPANSLMHDIEVT